MNESENATEGEEVLFLSAADVAADLIYGAPCDIYEVAGFRLYAYDVVESTNLLVKHAIAEGESAGFAAFAREQTGGYGRHGSRWASPRGGAYMSLLLRPDAPIEKLRTLGLVCALALHHALSAAAPDAAGRLAIKWPNDIVCLDAPTVSGPQFQTDAYSGTFRKLAGISFELIGGAVCLGIGVNVRRPAASVAAQGMATSTAAIANVRNTPIYLEDFICPAPDPQNIALSVLSEFAGLYSSWNNLKAVFVEFATDFNSLLAFVGYEVKVCLDDGCEIAHGRLHGVDAQGRLLVGNTCVTSGSISLI
jgi:BirA family biotin operon repressor/biotin-[acetyl-CoA-carboxylase] ligase